MTNCLFFAIALYLRRRGTANRRYLVARWSDSGPFPHFLYGELRRGRARLISYKPLDPHDKTCPPPVFRGRVCWGDAPIKHH
jgi:hypothetical protein